jgi:iron complex transport system substrate-binding protein
VPRIVYFLPAGTEILDAIGGIAALVGRSHECDFPADVKRLPVVSKPSLDLNGMTQAEIDTAVAGQLQTGESLYTVDEVLLNELAPDVILTQDLCQVCAPSGNELTRAVLSITSKPQVLYLSPSTLADIDANIIAVGEAVGRAEAARALVEAAHARVDSVRDRVRGRETRRVTFLEWVNPYFCAGHWVPEMIEIAGGHDSLGRAGGDSVRMTWDDVVAANPEIVVVAPCGFGLSDAEALSRTLPAITGARVVPVDANAFFARPGPRYVDGIELLSRLFHPDR